MNDDHELASCPWCGQGKFPLADVVEGRRVYHPALPWWTVAGALLGALGLGLAAYLMADGGGIDYLGQFYSGGDAVAVFTAASVGFALGGLIGASAAVFLRMGKVRD